jgi:hypothetical protein
MRVRIGGDQGQRFKVQRTTDFQNWTDVTNMVSQSPPIEMTLSVESSRGFYRTVNTE